MAYKLEITLGAEIETQNAIDYYFEINDTLADRFLQELRLVYTKIATHPQHYKYIQKKQHESFRYTKLKSFPFIVVFRIEEVCVIVYKVFNTYRKPWYK